MMHLLVNDLNAWWKHIESLDLVAKYGVRAPEPTGSPALGPDGRLCSRPIGHPLALRPEASLTFGPAPNAVGKYHKSALKRGLWERPKDWEWSGFLHYATGQEGRVEIESEWTPRRRERAAGTLAPAIELPTQAKRRLEWATRHSGSVELARSSAEVYASARFMLLMASSISPVLLNPIVAQSTPAFRKANLIAFTRSSWLFWN
jgi:hypothetical protein